MSDDLYRLTWDSAFEQFVQSIEEYVALELPDDASPAECQLQEDLKLHLETYKKAKEKEEKEAKRDRNS